MIILKHKESALLKKCVTGFSWTTFFFGLMERGFVPADVSSKNWCVANGLLGAG